MKSYGTTAVIFFLFFSNASGETIQQIGKEGMVLLTGGSGDSTCVVNFRATWRSPCVKQTGYFEDLHRSRMDARIKVMLVCLDFPNQLESRNYLNR